MVAIAPIVPACLAVNQVVTELEPNSSPPEPSDKPLYKAAATMADPDLALFKEAADKFWPGAILSNTL